MPLKGYVLQVMISVEVLWLCWQFLVLIAFACSWRRKWQPTPVFLPRESCGQRSLVGCCPWSHRVRHN